MIERRRQQVGYRRGASQRGERKALKADSGCDGCNGLSCVSGKSSGQFI